MSDKHLSEMGISKTALLAFATEDMTKVTDFKDACWVHSKACDENKAELRLKALFRARELMKTFEEISDVCRNAYSEVSFYKTSAGSILKANELRLEALSRAGELMKTFKEAQWTYGEASREINKGVGLNKLKLKSISIAGKLMKTFGEAGWVYKNASGKLKDVAFKKAMACMKTLSLKEIVEAHQYQCSSTKELETATCAKTKKLIKTFKEARHAYEEARDPGSSHRFSDEFRAMAITKAGELVKTVEDAKWFCENATSDLEDVALTKIVNLMKTFEAASFIWDTVRNGPAGIMDEAIKKAGELARTFDQVCWAYQRSDGELKVKLLAKLTEPLKTFEEAHQLYKRTTLKEEFLLRATELIKTFAEAQWVFFETQRSGSHGSIRKLACIAFDKAIKLMKTPEEAEWVYNRTPLERKTEILTIIAQLED